MVIDFKNVDYSEQPHIAVLNSYGEKIGIINNVKDLKISARYNEMSSIEFSVYEHVNHERTNMFDSITGLTVVEVIGIGRFVIVNPTDTMDGVGRVRSCTGYSLEYELTYKKITLETDTYNFYSPTDDHTKQSNILDIIISMLPSWSVGDIDAELYNKYRTFDVSGENIYNFIKNTLQESYNCIFDFDTFNRTINVVSANSNVPVKQVFLSNNNLAKEIKVNEETDNIVTKLDVNGADGVDIRDVSPDGTNTLINLDYYMNDLHFQQSTIDKYELWKETYSENKSRYYHLSVEHSLQIMKRETETAKLETLNGELLSLESQKSVKMQGGESTSEINSQISSKNSEISNQKQRILEIDEYIESLLEDMKEINLSCKFDSFFSSSELKAIDHYIKEDSVSESSFASVEKEFASTPQSGSVVNESISITDSNIQRAVNKSGTKYVYAIVGGDISISDSLNTHTITGEIIRASYETSNGSNNSNNDCMITAYLGNGTLDGVPFRNSCISITGVQSGTTVGQFSYEDGVNSVAVGTSVSFQISNGFSSFTVDTNEYKMHSISWDLLEYGEDILRKVSQPTYSFSVSSANFLCIEDFVSFKNQIGLGDKIYLEVSDGYVIRPILIGVVISYADSSTLELEFGDKYISSDSAFQLVDLLDQSISMGKSIDTKKFTYSSFIDSGANTAVSSILRNAIDVSKTAILSSKNQAFSINDAGIRLRKWYDDTHTSYDDKQIWMSNNSIMLTTDNWDTAKMAIGEMRLSDNDEETSYGVAADCILGKLIAGNSLVIESQKKENGVSVFSVDGSGCNLYNCSFELSQSGGCRIRLNPTEGISIYRNNSTNDSDKVFFADSSGSLNLISNIRSASAIFRPSTLSTSESYYADISDGKFRIGTCTTNGETILGQFDIGKETPSPGESTTPLLRPDGSHIGLVATKSCTGMVFGTQNTDSNAENPGAIIMKMVIRNRDFADDGLRNWIFPECDIVMTENTAVETDLHVGGDIFANGDISGTFIGELNGATGTFTGTSSGTITGTLNNAGGTFSGMLNGATGTFTGDIGNGSGVILLDSSNEKYYGGVCGNVYDSNGNVMWDYENCKICGTINHGTYFDHLASFSPTGNMSDHITIKREDGDYGIVMGFGVGDGGMSRPRLTFINNYMEGYLWMNSNAELYWSYNTEYGLRHRKIQLRNEESFN